MGTGLRFSYKRGKRKLAELNIQKSLYRRRDRNRGIERRGGKNHTTGEREHLHVVMKGRKEM